MWLVEQTLTERYAEAPPWRRPVTIVVVAVVALIALGWLAWVVYDQSTPKVESQLVTFRIVDEHAVSARIDVKIAHGATGATCTVEALALDHSVVGELHFTPTPGTNQVTVRTERMATSVDVPGCTANGQNRAR